MQEAIEELQAETGKTALFLQIDLADLRSIKEGVSSFLRYVGEWGLSTSITDLGCIS